KLDNIASMSSWLIAAGSAAGAGEGGGAGATATGFVSGLAGLAASSSAMIRRMEARISSIEGSCAFAGWFISASLSSPPGRLAAGVPTRITPTGRRGDDSDYRNSPGGRKQAPVDIHVLPQRQGARPRS